MIMEHHTLSSARIHNGKASIHCHTLAFETALGSSPDEVRVAVVIIF